MEVNPPQPTTMAADFVATLPKPLGEVIVLPEADEVRASLCMRLLLHHVPFHSALVFARI